jgi:hypothetical protein
VIEILFPIQLFRLLFDDEGSYVLGFKKPLLHLFFEVRPIMRIASILINQGNTKGETKRSGFNEFSNGKANHGGTTINRTKDEVQGKHIQTYKYNS